MRNKTFIALFAALIAVLLVVTGCAFNGPDTAGGIPAGKGKLVLSVGGTGRTILPSGVTHTYELFDVADALEYANDMAEYEAAVAEDPDTDVEKPEFPTAKFEGAVTTDGAVVDPGEYVLRVVGSIGGKAFSEAWVGDYVEAKEADPDATPPKPAEDAYFDNTVEVVAQGTATVIVKNFRVLDNEATKGTFSWNLSAFDTATSVKITIGDDSAIELKSTPGTDEYGFTDTIELAVGQYLVVFTVDGVEWSEVLWIYGDLTSAYTPSFPGNDIVGEKIPKDLQNVVIAAIKEGKLSSVWYSYFGSDLVDVDVGDSEEYYDENVTSAIAAILSDRISNAAPTNLSELKVLIDAAFVRAGADAILADSSDVENDLKALVKNGTTAVAYDSTEKEVTVGAYTFSVESPLVVKEVWFSVDISALVEGQASNPFKGKPTYAVTDGKGKISFASSTWGENGSGTSQDQGAAFALTSDQVALVKAADSLIVNFAAESSVSDAVFRGCLGSIKRGGGWNHTDMYLNGGTIGSISGIHRYINITNKTSTVDGSNPPEADALIHFILQKRNATPAEVDVTISSIKIKAVTSTVVVYHAPLVIENVEIEAKGSAALEAGDTGYMEMSGANAMLTYKFPADVGNWYNTVKVTYEAETTSTGDNEGATRGATLKNGYDSWSDVTPATYLTLESSGTFTWKLSLFTGTTAGFSLQQNKDAGDGGAYPKISEYKVKITKIEFTAE